MNYFFFYQNPKQGEAYNVGGGRFSNSSMLEGIAMCEEITGNKMNYSYSDTNRIGDHIWYISDMSKFKNHYPEWTWKYDMKQTLTQMFEEMKQRV